jgi:hypothetical protein
VEEKLQAKAMQNSGASPRPKATTAHVGRKKKGGFKVFGCESVFRKNEHTQLGKI